MLVLWDYVRGRLLLLLFLAGELDRGEDEEEEEEKVAADW